jgi:uridine kinase
MSRGGSGDRGPEAATGQTIGAADQVLGAATGQTIGAADQVLGAAARWRATAASGPGVIILAIDGHGAAGKSTIAEAVASATGAALVHTDDFFQGRPAPPPVRPALADYYDWRRLRAQALKPLRARLGAVFRRFDWERGCGLDGTVTVEPSDLIVIEGVYSAAPELRDLVDRSVFVDTPEPERLRRLRGRVKPEEWDDQWLLAEQAYFDVIRPPSSFDLIVSGADLPPELTRR